MINWHKQRGTTGDIHVRLRALKRGTLRIRMERIDHVIAVTLIQKHQSNFLLKWPGLKGIILTFKEMCDVLVTYLSQCESNVRKDINEKNLDLRSSTESNSPFTTTKNNDKCDPFPNPSPFMYIFAHIL